MFTPTTYRVYISILIYTPLVGIDNIEVLTLTLPTGEDDTGKLILTL